MTAHKGKIEENKAIANFIIFITSEIENKWTELSTIIQQIVNIKFDPSRKYDAKVEILAVYFAIELLDLMNLLPKETTYRITQKIELMLARNLQISDFWKRIIEYQNSYQIGIQKGEDPIISVSALVYSNLVLHYAIDRDRYRRLSDEGAIINPSILSNLARLFYHNKPFWRPLLEQSEITESDLPILHECPFEDFIPEKETNNYPDGTFFIEDEHGSLMKKWMPPEFFFDLIEKGIAERVYQVLIKGPWDGIKQMKIKLTEEQKSQFLDENERGYAIAWYEKEKLLYKLFEKQVWDKLDV